MELGVNTFGMGGLLKAPFRRTIGRLKENGITGMEPCIHFLSKASGRDLLIELGMKRTERLGGVWTPDEAKEKIGLLRKEGFNAYFGNTNFSQKWAPALNGKLIEKKVLDGVCKYCLFL